MEINLTLEELELIVKSQREKEKRLMRFYAAFKGVDFDEENGDSVGAEEHKRNLEAVQRRAEARLNGLSEEEIDQAGKGEGATEYKMFEEMGFEVETG